MFNRIIFHAECRLAIDFYAHSMSISDISFLQYNWSLCRFKSHGMKETKKHKDRITINDWREMKCSIAPSRILCVNYCIYSKSNMNPYDIIECVQDFFFLNLLYHAFMQSSKQPSFICVLVPTSGASSPKAALKNWSKHFSHPHWTAAMLF